MLIFFATFEILKNIFVWVAYLSIKQEYDYTYRYVFRKLFRCSKVSNKPTSRNKIQFYLT